MRIQCPAPTKEEKREHSDSADEAGSVRFPSGLFPLRTVSGGSSPTARLLKLSKQQQLHLAHFPPDKCNENAFLCGNEAEHGSGWAVVISEVCYLTSEEIWSPGAAKWYFLLPGTVLENDVISKTQLKFTPFNPHNWRSISFHLTPGRWFDILNYLSAWHTANKHLWNSFPKMLTLVKPTCPQRDYTNFHVKYLRQSTCRETVFFCVLMPFISIN